MSWKPWAPGPWPCRTPRPTPPSDVHLPRRGQRHAEDPSRRRKASVSSTSQPVEVPVVATSARGTLVSRCAGRAQAAARPSPSGPSERPTRIARRCRRLSDSTPPATAPSEPAATARPQPLRPIPVVSATAGPRTVILPSDHADRREETGPPRTVILPSDHADRREETGPPGICDTRGPSGSPSRSGGRQVSRWGHDYQGIL
jgi:hypothetical protein